MTESKPPDIAALMAPLRAKEAARKAQKAAEKKQRQNRARNTGGGVLRAADASHSHEALMTLVAIMKDPENPRLQIAAAKTLLDRGFKAALGTAEDSREDSPSQDDIDAAIALAKAVLDALAAGKAGGVDGARQLDPEGAPETDHA